MMLDGWTYGRVETFSIEIMITKTVRMNGQTVFPGGWGGDSDVEEHVPAYIRTREEFALVQHLFRLQ